MKAYIEQIEAGHEEIKLPFGIVIKETPDQLDISNGKGFSSGVLSIITALPFGYKQLGTFKIKRPHNFREREWVEIKLDDNDKIIFVRRRPRSK